MSQDLADQAHTHMRLTGFTIVLALLTTITPLQGQRSIPLTSIGKLTPEFSNIPNHLVRAFKNHKKTILGAEVKVVITDGECEIFDQTTKLKKVAIGRHRVKLARMNGGKKSNYFVDVIFDGQVAKVVSASGWALKHGKQRAFVLDANLNGKLDAEGADGVLQAHSRTVAPFHGEVWFFGLGIQVSAKANKVIATPLTPHQSKMISEGLAALNYYRQICGLRCVSVDAEASKGCALHAKYDSFNWGSGQGRQKEDPKNRYYTEAGDRIAKTGCHFGLTEKPGLAAVINLDGVYQRRGVLVPTQSRIGMGTYSGRVFDDRNDAITVIAMSIAKGPSYGVAYPLVYPAQGQLDVPTEFRDLEIPRPIPDGLDKGKLGYPVSINLEFLSDVGSAKLQLFALRQNKRRKVAGYNYGPGNTLEGSGGGTYDHVLKMNNFLVHFIAKKPLKPNQRYLAVATWTLNATEFKREWEFKTGRRSFSFDGHGKY
ncbi:MAG: hypothetical protein ACI97A_000485 [Planctomycetota bacterium]|jgi:hypothetical protein